VRFLFLVNSLRSEEMPLSYKADVILFINTLINSASSLEVKDATATVTTVIIIIVSVLLISTLMQQRQEAFHTPCPWRKSQERILIRADLLYAGITEHLEAVKSAPIIEERPDSQDGSGGGMSDERFEAEVQIEV
jgi:K+-sensing histidine kinase KdpD